jgi:hypothetical protein
MSARSPGRSLGPWRSAHPARVESRTGRVPRNEQRRFAEGEGWECGINLCSLGIEYRHLGTPRAVRTHPALSTMHPTRAPSVEISISAPHLDLVGAGRLVAIAGETETPPLGQCGCWSGSESRSMGCRPKTQLRMPGTCVSLPGGALAVSASWNPCRTRGGGRRPAASAAFFRMRVSALFLETWLPRIGLSADTALSFC